jgi:hypothetical protein
MNLVRIACAIVIALLLQLCPVAQPASGAAVRVCDPPEGGIYPNDCPRFGNPDNYLANNRHHRVDFHDTLESTGVAAQWVLDNRFSDLGFTWAWVDGSDYDVRIQDGYFPNAPWFGNTTCPASATIGGTSPRRWCYGQLLRLNLSNVGGWDTTSGRRVLLCHELGHSVGLNHPEGGDFPTTCLENTVAPDKATSSAYDQVDQNNVNGGY